MEKTQFFTNILPTETLSYKNIYMENNGNLDLNNVNVIGCIIKDSIFQMVNFCSADFDGTILNHCDYSDCDWSRVDCCSLTAVDTTFNQVDFTLSTMRDCEFKKCTFINCTFEHIALSGSTFQDCKFIKIHLLQSSTYLNTYTNCEFEHCNINGNFYYNMLIDNKYYKTFFQEKLLAYNYFITESGMALELIGYRQDIRDDLRNYLIEYNLLINLVLFELNEYQDVDMAVIRFIVAIRKLIEINILIREEQLRFLYNLLYYFITTEKISVVTIAEALSCLEEMFAYFEEHKNETFIKSKSTLKLIKNELSMFYQSIGSIIAYSADSSMRDTEKIVKIVYEEEPQIPICSIINEIKAALKIEAPNAVRIKAEKGSFHEWISCYDSVLGCLQLFVAVLGLGYSVINTHQKHVCKNNQLEEEPMLNADNPNQMIALINKALSKQKINPEFNQTISIVVKNEVIASKKFRGYNRSNIQSIDITTKND